MSSEQLEFAALRSRGIAWLQELTGQRWTDYNLHDPGVTLLETMVYGLTDLAYRIEFETADLLAAPTGLDLDALGLVPPDRALPPRPVTVADLRAAVVAAVPELRNVWVIPAADGSTAGLVDVFVWTGHSLDAADEAPVLKAARAAYDAVRGLGEDAARFGLMGEVPCRLEGQIQVERDRDAAEIVAEMFDRCAERLTRGMYPIAIDVLRREANSLEDALTVPLSPLGVFTSEDQKADMNPDELTGEKLAAPRTFFREVAGISGVLRVDALRLRVPPPAADAATSPALAELVFPADQADVDALALNSRGRRIEVAVGEVRRHLHRLRVERARAARVAQDTATIADPPPAVPRDLARYTLLQDHLPPAYGVTPGGLPSSAPKPLRARARQLRGYLMHAERPLADAMAAVDDLPRLFARNGVDRTYATATDLSAALPPRDRDLAARDADAAVASRDDVVERRGRLLDYLLALYGEAFTQNSLRTFDVYRAGEERFSTILGNREAFLAAVETLTRDRGGGARLDHPEDPGSFARRLGILLECRVPGPGPRLGAAFSAHDLRLEEDETAAWLRLARADLQAEGDPLAALVPLVGREDDEALEAALGDLREHGLFAGDRVPPAWLANGIRIEHYGLRPLGDGCELWLDDGDPDTVAYLGRFGDRDTAIAVANRLRRALIKLCRGGEGLHVVERVLLRPRSPGATTATDLARRRFRVAVAATGWTPRTRQPGFRQLVAETVRLNAPAHVAPSCRWFETPQTMLAFEAAHLNWRELLARHLAEPADRTIAGDLDEAAAGLEARLDDAVEEGV